MHVLRERRFDLRQAAYTLKRAFLPARVTLQRGEKSVHLEVRLFQENGGT
jgi:hypothetical protein